MIPPALMLAILSAQPGPPAKIELTFAPMPVNFATPSDTEPKLHLIGMIHVTDAAGRWSPLEGDLDVMLTRPVPGAALLPADGDAHHRFLARGLSSLVTTDDGGRRGYHIRLTWPDGWVNDGSVRVKAWVKAKGGDLRSPEFELIPPKAN